MLPIDDTAQVDVSGPGLTSGMCAWRPQTFTVDCTCTRKVPQFVAIMTPDGTIYYIRSQLLIKYFSNKC